MEANKSALWYVASSATPLGPFSWQELNGQIASGTLGQDSFVWRAGLDDWVEALSVAGLFNPPDLAKGPPPIPRNPPPLPATAPAPRSPSWSLLFRQPTNADEARAAVKAGVVAGYCLAFFYVLGAGILFWTAVDEHRVLWPLSGYGHFTIPLGMVALAILVIISSIVFGRTFAPWAGRTLLVASVIELIIRISAIVTAVAAGLTIAGFGGTFIYTLIAGSLYIGIRGANYIARIRTG
jgi:hypothetical protein